jgi:NAD(P)-dependent dehydrogenase (short-subunit alcohol dehydrogenase family)
MKALVTGASGGIGRATVDALLGAGWDVVATAQTEAELAAIPEALGLVKVPLDVTQDASVNACIADLDRLDAVVNCAGILRRGEEHQLDVFEQVIAVNLTGTMRVCTASYPLLRESKGAIVNLASMLSYFGGPLVPAYSASKGGVMQLTKSLAAAWAVDGIRVNSVAPGWIETDMTANLRSDPQRNATILARTPLGRWGEPSEVAVVIVLLLSSETGFVTGVTLPVDGGYSAV